MKWLRFFRVVLLYRDLENYQKTVSFSNGMIPIGAKNDQIWLFLSLVLKRQNLCSETKHFITTVVCQLHLRSFSTNPSCRIVQHYSMNSVPGRQLMVKGTDGFFQQRTLPWITNSPWTNNNNIGNYRSNLAQHRNKDKSWTNNDQYLF